MGRIDDDHTASDPGNHSQLDSGCHGTLEHTHCQALTTRMSEEVKSLWMPHGQQQQQLCDLESSKGDGDETRHQCWVTCARTRAMYGMVTLWIVRSTSRMSEDMCVLRRDAKLN